VYGHVFHLEKIKCSHTFIMRFFVFFFVFWKVALTEKLQNYSDTDRKNELQQQTSSSSGGSALAEA